MHSLFGLHFITTAMSPSSPAILNPPPLGVVRIDALSAALEQLGFGVQIDAILDAVKRLEEERDAKPAAPSAAAKRTAMVRLGQEIPPPKRKIDAFVHIHLRTQIIPSVDPKSKERRKRLIAMTKEAFPLGTPLPDPYASIWVTARSAPPRPAQ